MLVKLIKTEGVEMADLQPLNVKPMLELLDRYTGGKPLLEHLECAVHMRLVDSDGRDVEPGQRGRILVKSPCMFRGYPNQPERTAARFNKDNWFMSYDQARIDPSNRHVFSGGRIDAIILHGQYMLFPCWLEAMVAPHPAVKKVISVPFSDVVLFHAIGICIIKHPGASVSEEEVIDLVLSHVVPGKEFLIRPKAVLFFDKFPLKPDGTVDKPRLSDIVSERVNDGMNS
ncbi:4-coumarate--CoA ligase-like 4 [Elysia marginata]|uniref:4-coumarate--CoA ligase-like 4 n=1 Tax=Elysia marginata TaxID=1093978 RepID=A0AAV4JRQ4_9GAST|nr:4-coumarate--CoA ligase-like 4 [Elysia marginata]